MPGNCMEDSLSREQALEFLEGMERRHNEVLDSLAELNARIEGVLAKSVSQANEVEAAASEVSGA